MTMRNLRIGCAALAALLLVAGGAHGDVFNYLSAPVDVTPTTADAWVDVDCSTWVPAGATGVILQASNPNSSMNWGCRKNGSTDAWLLTSTLRSDSHGFYMIGVDANRFCEVYTDDTTVKTYLLGYTTAGATFFTNAVNKSIGSTGSFVDVDISADTGTDTAIGAIFIFKNTDTGASKTYSVRKNGSTDDHYQPMHNSTGSMVAIGVDASEICELKISSTDLDSYLVGYITSGATFFTNSVDKSTGTTGSYQDVDITSDAGTDNPTGAFVELVSSSQRYVGLRPNGHTHDYYRQMRHMFAVVGLDSGDIFEQKIGDTAMDVYLLGYTKPSAVEVVNRRSVGTNAGVLYSTGNATINSGTSTVTFAGGASLPTNVGQGDKLTIGGSTTFYILSRDSSTQATVQETASSTLTAQSYDIRRAYNDFQSWETARQGNLVGEYRNEFAYAYDDGDFTTGVTIDGSTTDASHFMRITTAAGHYHSGLPGAGAVIDMNNTGTAVTISDDWVDLEGLQITRCGGAAGRSGVYVVNAANIELKAIYVYNYDSGFTCRGVRFGTSATATIWNSVVHDGEGYGIHADTGSANVVVFNCTVYGIAGTGIQRSAGLLNVHNTMSMGCSTADLAGTMTQTYNISSDSTASGTGSLTSKYASNQFVNLTAGAEDLHLKSGSDAVGTGTDLSLYFVYDVDLVGRPAGAAWDIGADERAAGSTDANYRSVGTNAGTIYSTGNCSIAAGSTTATFAGGASLPANVGQGDKLTVGSTVFYLLSRDSAIQATVQVSASSALTTQAYTITRAYNDFQSWETARQGDLVSDNRCEVAVAYDDGDFTSGVTIDGSTTDATRYLAITVASTQRHAAVAGAGAIIDMNNTGSAILANDDYTRIEWLQLRRFNGADNRAGVLVAANNVLAQYLIAYDYNTGHVGAGVRCNSGSVTVRNCLIYTGSLHAIRNAGGTLTAQNCTVGGVTGVGVLHGSGTTTVTNTISMGNNAAEFSGAMTQSYNMSDDGSASGTGSLPNQVIADQFVSVNPGSEDLHLKAGADALNAGTDLSGSFTTDFDGATRSGTWDMGADEWTATTTNYRSVGTNAGTLYATGVASIASGTTTVTFGSGASLPINVGQGDKLTIGGTIFHMLSRDSATQATVQDTAASTLTDQAYTIVRAYNSLQSWETARQGNLAGELRVEVAVAYDDGDLTSAVVIDGSTTSATHYMEITAASGQRHAGQAGVGAVIDMSDTGTGITVSDNYTRIGWLQVRETGGAINRAGVTVLNATDALLDGLLVYDFNGAACYGIQGDSNSSATLRNCIVYDGTGRGIVADAASSTLTVQNCTVYGIAGRGVSGVSGALTATNIIAMDCTVEDFGSGLTQSYNMSSDASASGAGSLPSRDGGDQFIYILAGNLNLHLKAGSEALNAGSDLSGSFNADVDNGSRAAPWDMGADESGAWGTGQKQTPRIATWKETAP